MNDGSLFLWSLFNAILPLILPFFIVLSILWFTNREQVFYSTFETFADGQLCVLAVTLSLITFYELWSIKDLAMTSWVVVLAVMLGLINALNDSEKSAQNQNEQKTLKTSKRKMASISLGVALASVISAIYCHNSIIKMNSSNNEVAVLEQNHEQP